MYRQLERLPAIGVCGSILFGLLLYILAVPCGRLDAAAPGTPVRTVVQAGHNIDVVSVAFARDEKIFASVDSFGRIRVWQLPQGRLLNSWKTNPGKGTDGLEASTVIAFDDEGRLVAIARNILTRWDPETGKQAEKTQLPFDGDAEFRLSSSGTVLAAWDSTMSPGNDPVKVSIWDVRKGIATSRQASSRAQEQAMFCCLPPAASSPVFTGHQRRTLLSCTTPVRVRSSGRGPSMPAGKGHRAGMPWPSAATAVL